MTKTKWTQWYFEGELDFLNAMKTLTENKKAFIQDRGNTLWIYNDYL